MADETKQLLEEVKELLNGFKEIGSYTRDLSQALGSMQRPMQQMSDISKAIAENMKNVNQSSQDVSKSSGESSSELAEVANIMKEQTKSMEDFLVKYKESVDKANEFKQLQIDTKKIEMERVEGWRRLDEERKKAAEQSERERDLIKESASWWDKIKQSAHDYQDNVAKAGNTMSAQAMRQGSQVMFGQSNFGGAMSSMTSALSALAPATAVGGLMGMMLYGAKQDAEFAAIGQQAAQQFDAIGGSSKKFVGEMAGLSRTLSVNNMASEQAVVAASQGFAQLGVTAKEASAKLEGYKGITGSVIEATIAADKAFELQEGTMARLSSTMARDFNMSAKEAFINLMNIGTAAEKAGQNAATFMQQTMEAASSLRLLNANMDAVGQTQLSMTKAMEGRGFRPGFAGQYAAAGTANAAQAVSGMSVGLSAIIGEKLGFGSGLDAWYAMKTGSGMSTRGGQELNTADVMREMRGIVQELSPNRSEQNYALQGLFGTDTAGADTILNVMEEVNSTGKISADSQKKLNDALKDEPKKTNELLGDIKKIQDGFANVSAGLLSLIINGLRALYDVGMGMYNWLRSIAEDDPQAKDTYSELSGIYFNEAGRAGGRSSAAINRIGNGFDEIIEGGGKGVKDLGISDPVSDASRKRIDVLNRRFNPNYAAENPADTGLGMMVPGVGLVKGALEMGKMQQKLVDKLGNVFHVTVGVESGGQTAGSYSGGSHK